VARPPARPRARAGSARTVRIGRRGPPPRRLAPGVRLPDDARPFFGLVSNGQGLRESHEIPRRKGARESRILCLGDSCTFGYLLPHDATWVERLERYLSARFPGDTIECINAGVPGWGLFQGWRFLETRARALAPDLVILNFGWNESVAWDGRSDLEHYAEIRASRPPAPLASSRLARLAFRAFAGAAPSAAPARRPRLLPHEFRELLERCLASARRLGTELLLLVGGARSNLERAQFGDYLSPLQVEQLEFGRRHPFVPDGGSSAIDGVAIVRELRLRLPFEAIFLDGVHATPGTNERIAEAIAARLAPWISARLAGKR
jgi:lysophospholipase L1-like esterase